MHWWRHSGYSKWYDWLLAHLRHWLEVIKMCMLLRWPTAGITDPHQIKLSLCVLESAVCRSNRDLPSCPSSSVNILPLGLLTAETQYSQTLARPEHTAVKEGLFIPLSAFSPALMRGIRDKAVCAWWKQRHTCSREEEKGRCSVSGFTGISGERLWK